MFIIHFIIFISLRIFITALLVFLLHKKCTKIYFVRLISSPQYVL